VWAYGYLMIVYVPTGSRPTHCPVGADRDEFLGEGLADVGQSFGDGLGVVVGHDHRILQQLVILVLKQQTINTYQHV
jgi:hypothetical protein